MTHSHISPEPGYSVTMTNTPYDQPGLAIVVRTMRMGDVAGQKVICLYAVAHTDPVKALEAFEAFYKPTPDEDVEISRPLSANTMKALGLAPGQVRPL